MTQGTEKQTSSRSPFARKSRTDIVVLYFKASAMNSAPFAPIWINILCYKERICITSNLQVHMVKSYLAPTKFKGFYVSMELDNFGQGLGSIWSNGIITKF